MNLQLLKDFCSDFFSSLGVGWLILRFSTFFFKSIEISTVWIESYYSFYCVISISILFAVFKNCPFRKIRFQISGTDAYITIKYGDIVKGGGNIAIPSSNYFNTSLKIIAKKSVLGQFIDHNYNGDNTAIDKDLRQSMNNTQAKETYVKVGNKKSYPIGTVGVFNAPNNKKGFLSAITHIVENPDNNKVKAESNIEYVFTALDGLWDRVNTELDDESLNIVPFGMGISKSFNKKVEAVFFLVQSFVNKAKKKRPCSELIVYIRREDIGLNDYSDLRKVVSLLTQ